jgi:hypothetical protein
MSQDATVLYRPVGAAELELIAGSGFRTFPPRLSHQPIFYPVLCREYAEQIARDWNTRDGVSGYVGFVTKFSVSTEYLSRYEPRTVGSSAHQEYWIPADELEAFNRHLIGEIRVIAEFRGEQAGPVAAVT